MTIKVTASSQVKTTYNFTETSSTSVRSNMETVNSAPSYTYGSGNLEINAGVKNTGVLPSGGATIVDLQHMSNTTFGVTSTVAFTGVKNVTVYNTSTVQNKDINIRATGSGAFTNLFNGGSGNLLVKPYSSFSYSDPYSLTVTGSQKNISLFDVSGSGATYEICILGTIVPSTGMCVCP
jgi:hypothetical protein